MIIMRDRYYYYFAAYSGGVCILKCQGRKMKVTPYYTSTPETREKEIYVSYIDDDGKHQQVMLSPNVAWTLEVENHEEGY